MLEQLRELLKHKKSQNYYANKLGISVEEVKELMNELKQENKSTTVTESNTNNTVSYENQYKVNVEKGTLESSIELDYEAKDPDELVKLHKVDLTRYKLYTYYSKLKSNGKFTSTVFATLKKPQDYTPEDFAKFLESYEPKPSTVTVVNWKTDEIKSTIDVEFSIADFHLAKKTLDSETMEDRKKQYASILDDLILKTLSAHKIDKAVFPISNDFFHSDNYQNTTTNGTPQDVLAGYDHEYEVGFDILVDAIQKLKRVANEVEVILVQGNHDRTKSFYVAHALEVFFRYTPKLTFKRDHSTTKSTVLGTTFIGYHHGNCKIDDLPLLFATGKDGKEFGNALYREVHTGDKHHYMAKEIKGVRIQQMPSLSGTDRWHQDNNFVHSIRAGLALFYNKQTGKCGEVESRIPCKH